MYGVEVLCDILAACLLSFERIIYCHIYKVLYNLTITHSFYFLILFLSSAYLMHLIALNL
jgi:hypothetical protein